MLMQHIETGRLSLRRWRPEDFPAFAAMNADARVAEFLRGMLTEEQSKAFFDSIEQHFSTYGFGLWAAEVKDGAACIGYVGLSIPRFDAHFTPCVEIGWRLAHAHWGHGYATEGAKAALRHGFDVVKLPQIVSFTVPDNIRSRAVMEKLGMTRDPVDDFDHPNIAQGHPLRRHVLYRKAAAG